MMGKTDDFVTKNLSETVNTSKLPFTGWLPYTGWFTLRQVKPRMGVKNEEQDFPRGRSSTSKPALRKVKDALFQKYKNPRKKIKKNKLNEKKQNKSESNQKPEIFLNRSNQVIRPLTYQSLEEGMVVVGRVREVWPTHMFLCLPSRLSAKVPLAAISDPYSRSLTQSQAPVPGVTHKECPQLKDLFREGQSVVCSIVEVKKEGGVLSVSASLEPALVNVGRAHHTVRAGQTLHAAVYSEEDHGYILHTGISGLTAFLPSSCTGEYLDKYNFGRPLAVGEVVRCVVVKCRSARSATRVEVTLDPDTLMRPLANSDLHSLQPATTVNCIVDQVRSNGLVVAVSEGGGTAYIETAQLAGCWAEPKHFKPKTELTASVLYVLPQSDFQMSLQPAYLTLKDINSCVTPKLTLGEVVEAVITYSSPKGVYLCLGGEKDEEMGNKGFVSIRRLGESLGKESVASRFPKGQSVRTRILAFDYMEQVYNCTFEKDKLEQQYVKVEQLKVGDRVSCRVLQVENNGLRLALGPIRVYAFKEHTADVPYMNLYQYFSVGDSVDARVLKVSLDLRQVSVTLKETLIRSPMLSSYSSARLGDCYWATVRHIRDKSLVVTFFDDVTGLVQLDDTELSQQFFPGHLVQCYITYVNVTEEKLLLSLTPPVGKQATQTKLTLGDSYQLVVNEVTPEHLAVSACDYADVQGIVPKTHLRNQDVFKEGDFLKSCLYHKRADVHFFSPHPVFKIFFKAHNNVKPLKKLTCCVTKITEKKIVVCTPLLQFSEVELSKKKLELDGEVKLHQILKLFVKHIDLETNTLELSCKKPKASDGPVVEPRKRKKSQSEEKSDSSVEDLNQTKPAKKNRTKSEEKPSKNILVPREIHQESDSTENEHNLSQSKKKNTKSNLIESVVEIDVNNLKLAIINKMKNKIGKSSNEGHLEPNLSEMDENKSQELSDANKCLVMKKSDPESEHESESNKKSKKRKKDNLAKSNDKEPKKLTLSESGFLWDVKPEDLNKHAEEPANESDEDVEDAIQGKKKKTAADRRKAAKEEEARLRTVEQVLLDSEFNPQSVDQFDRAVLARPDDAELWIKYMAHHLQATEIEKARAVARRALQTINQRHEVERLNVSIALLNLEHIFGTQESLKTSMDEALRTNDEFTVYCKMLQIYAKSKKSQEVEKLVNTILRKFRSLPACWVQACSSLMQCELPDKARNLLHRAITALPTKEHVNLLCKFALLENQYGFIDQAQTVFEHILTSYPKRTDVWNVYVDMLVKEEKLHVARQILERATRQKLPTRKMKMLFSKWMSFEEKHGTPEKVEYVRKQAIAYVTNITSKLD